MDAPHELRHLPVRYSINVIAIFVLVLLAGCRGDGTIDGVVPSDSSALNSGLVGQGYSNSGSGPELGTVSLPDVPVLHLSPRPIKIFHFSWEDVSGEGEYRLLEDPDGRSGYTQVASIAANSESHELEVFLPMRINARYILQACSSDGCVDSAPAGVSGTLAEAVGYFKASNSSEYSAFGHSVALSGNGHILAVGAPSESSGIGRAGEDPGELVFYSGAVYVFSREDERWIQQAYIKASEIEQFGLFGITVALSSDGATLAVGASGSVHIFERNGDRWDRQAELMAVGSTERSSFGNTVALSGRGDTLVVAALDEDEHAGAVYVFIRNAGDWIQQARLTGSDAGNSDFFGASIALSSDGASLAVGASRERNASGVPVGAAYIFVRGGENWYQHARVTNSIPEDEFFTDFFDHFGESVTLSADGAMLAVGAPYFDGAGAVFLFLRSGEIWSQDARLEASNPYRGDRPGSGARFGHVVALSAAGDLLAIGSPWENGDAVGINDEDNASYSEKSGAVYVLQRRDGVWSQIAYVKASNTEPDSGERYLFTWDEFGSGVALSADGGVLAVGAPGEDGAGAGISGSQDSNSARDAGAVYLY